MKAWLIRSVAVFMVTVSLGGVGPAIANAGAAGQNYGVGARSTVHAQTLKAYQHAEYLINRTFRLSIAEAKRSLRLALSKARTPGARSTARAKFALAVVTASTVRDAALVKLGPAPTPLVTRPLAPSAY